VTDPELVHRAEQAYLGALIARQGQPGTGTAAAGTAGPGAFSGLSAYDFTDPVHQAVYAALASQAVPARRGPAAVWERLRAALTRLLSSRARAASAYMTGLPGWCPDPANMAAYAAMIADASQARAASAPAASPAPPARPSRQPTAAEHPQLAGAAQWLDGARPGRRTAGMRQPDPAYTAPPAQPRRAPDGLDRQTARLARALGADARRLAAQPPPSAAPPAAAVRSQTAPLTPAALEEQVLADLMLHPTRRGDLTSWLPSAVFAAGNNRTLYELISARLERGRPVDPLIIAWDASALPAATGPDAARGEHPAAAALRLGALNPPAGTAEVLARPLYAERVCDASLGPNWPTQTGPGPAPDPNAAPLSAPAPAAGPAQARTTPAAGFRPGPAPNPAAQAQPAPAAAERVAPASPRHASGLPLRRPPVPGPAVPGPTLAP
jgi:hypothetical protein